jgi:hypothetical protein
MAARGILAGVPGLAVATALGTAGIVALALFEPEVIIRRSFEAALAGTPKGPDLAVSKGDSIDHGNVWLSRTDSQPLGFTAPVKVGDRIEISGRGRQRRSLEVFDIRELQTGLAPVADTVQRLLVVSCREIDGKDEHVVRFVMEAEEAVPATQKASAQRAL